MPDEIALVIATTLAAKGAEAVIAGGRNAFSALAGLLRGHFVANRRAATALDRALADPRDRQGQLALADALAAAMAADPRFAAQVLAHWRTARTEDLSGLVVNHVSGAAHKVIQARDIHGDVSI
ncbi:hypothetical protein ABT297_29745 [Dactylosporangium sp. NPDC000555]|uniref:hypothetical protein n=1 Tax=Dactylosporangium sp. NPDC000555 TaxID=3154260 RepID=UPI003326FFEF